jgi:hypothetical protein
MRYAFLVLISVIALMWFADQGGAVPNCNQITAADFCWPKDYCWAIIEWQGSCELGTREWRCHWQGSPQCHEETSSWQPCDCGGAGCDCLLVGTLVTLADGSLKPVEKIEKGDHVLSYDEITGRMGPSEVLKIHAPWKTDHYLVINGSIRVTETHPVLSQGTWVTTGELEVGSLMTGTDGLQVPVVSIRRVDEEALVYNFQVAAGTYVAQDIVLHNKEDCELYVQYPSE